MTFSILDNGNLVVSFDQEDEAYDALERLAAESEDGCAGLPLVAFDEHGDIAGECTPGECLAHRV